MADATPRAGGWAFRSVPPSPRSITELIRAGTLDAELAAMLWVLLAARVPLIVAAVAHGTGKSTLLGALLDFLPAGVRTVELAGSAETFEWLPQATELGWSRSHAPDLADQSPVRPDDTVIVIPDLSDHLPTYTWGEEARSPSGPPVSAMAWRQRSTPTHWKRCSTPCVALRSAPRTMSCRASVSC